MRLILNLSCRTLLLELEVSMFAIALALLMVLSACSSAPTGPAAARALIDESAMAMGGWAALDSV